eukprot:CAMPEP_0198351216 /NCGR_PEP_ID=MMETSP1450-20131203/101937_1 /TAXON_ID=753684 ORGANISM="Madagascaria erythrocladiodes, Strain CCMP3234" /NCGR_SAMPLE_ID=MMETSP1450 /ASSEMBLY_ACC=CAM_ASM_001115 /LENGTH=104 /DNA_ID=CAMNT_0044057111 /DNA_START=233 /DNA_END=544 /DNA_ORIENTATION=+
MCSATIGNPLEHAERLCGRQGVEVVNSDGSSRSAKVFCIWNPPLADGHKQGTGARRSANNEAALILAELVTMGVRTIAFAGVRKLVEIWTKNTRRKVGPGLADL